MTTLTRGAAPSPGPTLPQVAVWIAAATALAAALRLLHLGTGSFWIDEVFSIRSAADLSAGHWQWTKALGYLPTAIGVTLAGIDLTSIDSAAPHTWRAAGLDEITVRLPSVIIGVATVPLLAWAARPIVGGRGAVILALLLAIAPWHIYWSQTARFYVVQFLFYNLALIAYFTATRPLSRQRFLLAMTFTVLAYLSQPTSVILGAVFAIDWLAAAVRKDAAGPVRLGAWGWGAAALGAAVCAGFTALDALAPKGQYLGSALSDWPMQQSPAGILLGSAYLIWPTVAAVAALSCLWLSREQPRTALCFGVAAALPVALFGALALRYPVGSRYCFVALFPCLVLVTLSLDRMWVLLRERGGFMLAATPIAAVAVSALIATMIAYNSFGNLRSRWRDAVAYVAELRREGEPVYAGMPQIAAYYLGEEVRPLPASPEELAGIHATAWFVVDVHSRGKTARFWLLPDAELVDFFPLRASHTSSSVQVYRHRPR